MAEESRTDIVIQTSPEIQGDSGTAGHENWIRCESVDFTTARSIGPIEDRKLGGASFSGLTITRRPDKASALLFAQHLQSTKDKAKLEVTVDFVESGGEVNMQLTLTEAFIKEYELNAASEDMTETLVIDGEKLTVKVGDSERNYNYKTRQEE